jgi:membrane protease YdiL (CAAX protease family)
VLFAIVVSFSEELTYRGYCLQRIEVSLGRPVAVVLSSLVFGLMHLPTVLASQLPGWQILAALCSLALSEVALAGGFVLGHGTLGLPWSLQLGHNLGEPSPATAELQPAWLCATALPRRLPRPQTPRQTASRKGRR